MTDCRSVDQIELFARLSKSVERQVCRAFRSDSAKPQIGCSKRSVSGHETRVPCARTGSSICGVMHDEVFGKELPRECHFPKLSEFVFRKQEVRRNPLQEKERGL